MDLDTAVKLATVITPLLMLVALVYTHAAIRQTAAANRRAAESDGRATEADARAVAAEQRSLEAHRVFMEEAHRAAAERRTRADAEQIARNATETLRKEGIFSRAAVIGVKVVDGPIRAALELLEREGRASIDGDHAELVLNTLPGWARAMDEDWPEVG